MIYESAAMRPFIISQKLSRCVNNSVSLLECANTYGNVDLICELQTLDIGPTRCN